MPTIPKFLMLGLLLVLTACGAGERAENEAETADSEASFEAFAQHLYRRLDDKQLSDTMQVEIGMFGDLNVMAGEHVVMGRYRYRVDTVSGPSVGHLTFLARSSDEGRAVPIVLAFQEEGGSWMVQKASYVLDDTVQGGTVAAVLDRRLDSWVRRAASEVAASSR